MQSNFQGYSRGPKAAAEKPKAFSPRDAHAIARILVHHKIAEGKGCVYVYVGVDPDWRIEKKPPNEMGIQI